MYIYLIENKYITNLNVQKKNKSKEKKRKNGNELLNI